MNPVRFGRVLGTGARVAAKTVVAAVDAAAAPNPNPPKAPAQPSATLPRFESAKAAAITARTTGKGVREGAKRFGREVWNPFVRLSGVLWLEVTGVFFGIFALFALGAAWRLRAAWHPTAANSAEHNRLLGAIAMGTIFGYFTLTSFLSASRRARRR